MVELENKIVELESEKDTSGIDKNNLSDLFGIVIDNLSTGFIILTLNGKILKVNKVLLKTSGYAEQELVGKNAMRLANIFPPQSIKRIVGSFLDARRGVPGDHYVLEAKDKFGRSKMIELTNSLIVKDGKKLAIAVMIRDVTEDIANKNKLIEAEKNVKESENLYKLLFDTSQDAIMTIEPPHWKFASGNPAAIKMFNCKDEKEFVSLGPWDVSPENQPDGQLSNVKAKAMIEKAMKDGSSFFEWIHKRHNGNAFPATVLLTRFKLNSKDIIQATVRDVTEEKKRIEELEIMNKAMVGRELKMMELKKKISKLEEQIKNKQYE